MRIKKGTFFLKSAFFLSMPYKKIYLGLIVTVLGHHLPYQWACSYRSFVADLEFLVCWGYLSMPEVAREDY